MKVYQLVFKHDSYEEGYVTTSGRIYVHKEDAEAAKAWLDTIPDNPCVPPTTVEVKEIEVEEFFTPWISQEEINSLKDEYNDYRELMEYDEDWGGDEYD